VSDAWHIRDASAGVVVPGRFGRQDGTGVKVVRRAGLGLASVTARKGREADLSAALRDLIGVVPPKTPKAVNGKESLIWSGPGQWLLVTGRADGVAPLASKLDGLAAVVDQSDARAVLRLSGARIRETLAKGCLIDLHPRAFKPGDAAQTAIAHIGVQLWQIDDAPAYDLTVARSLIGSFWSWFEASAAEFGYAVE
jgi:sarcosine oxidase subunit gamma